MPCKIWEDPSDTRRSMPEFLWCHGSVPVYLRMWMVTFAKFWWSVDAVVVRLFQRDVFGPLRGMGCFYGRMTVSIVGNHEILGQVDMW